MSKVPSTAPVGLAALEPPPAAPPSAAPAAADAASTAESTATPAPAAAKPADSAQNPDHPEGQPLATEAGGGGVGAGGEGGRPEGRSSAEWEKISKTKGNSAQTAPNTRSQLLAGAAPYGWQDHSICRVKNGIYYAMCMEKDTAFVKGIAMHNMWV